MDAIFEITAERLRTLPQKEWTCQTARALRERTELLSRQQLPELWKVTDRLRSTPQAPAPVLASRRKRSKMWSALCLLLGIFALLPGLIEPREPTLILVGLTAAAWGLLGLLSKHPDARFHRPAEQLLEPYFSLPQDAALRVSFTAGEMILENAAAGAPQNRRMIPYDDFECAFGTDSLYFLAYAGKGMILPKNCMVSGSAEDFQALLSSKTTFSDLSRDSER